MILMQPNFAFIKHVDSLKDVADYFLSEGFIFESIKAYPPQSKDDDDMSPLFLRALRCEKSQLGIHEEEQETPFFVGYLNTLPLPAVYYVPSNYFKCYPSKNVK